MRHLADTSARYWTFRPVPSSARTCLPTYSSAYLKGGPGVPGTIVPYSFCLTNRWHSGQHLLWVSVVGQIVAHVQDVKSFSGGFGAGRLVRRSLSPTYLLQSSATFCGSLHRDCVSGSRAIVLQEEKLAEGGTGFVRVLTFEEGNGA